MFIPIVAAAIALIAALAGYAMVKFFGIVFLGQHRDAKLQDAHDAGPWERVGMAWLAAGCIFLGLFPTFVIQLIDLVTVPLVGSGLAHRVETTGWWLLAPTSIERASYGPVFFLAGVVVCWLFAYVLVRRFYHGRLRRADPWDCGHPWQTPRMQDTAEGFGQPIRQIFEPFLRLERHLPSSFDREPAYRVVVRDHFWHWLSLPVARGVEFLAAQVGRLQRGRIAVYLLYSFLTLLFMLYLTQR